MIDIKLKMLIIKINNKMMKIVTKFLRQFKNMKIVLTMNTG